MTVFLYPSAEAAPATYDAAMAFTHGDHYKPLPGYQVMNHHYHMDLGQRLVQAGSLDAEIPDLVALKALGINIVSQIDSIMGGGGEPTPDGATFPGGTPITAATRPAAEPPRPRRRGAARPGRRPGRCRPSAPARATRCSCGYNSIEGARRHSDTGFLVMPSQEYYGSPLGGHTDLLFSRPVYWVGGRTAGQPLVEEQQPVRQALSHRQRRRSDGDGAARGHAHQHAASADEGLDRLSRFGQGPAVLQAIRTIRASASAGAWGSIGRKRGSASTAASRSSTT